MASSTDETQGIPPSLDTDTELAAAILATGARPFEGESEGVLGNLVAAGSMGAYLWRAHPTLARRFGAALAGEET